MISTSEDICYQTKVYPRPFVSKTKSVTLAQRLFSLEMTPHSVSAVEELDSYRDRNFLVKGRITQGSEETRQEAENLYVLKVLGPLNSKNPERLDVMLDVLDFIGPRGIKCPVAVPSVFEEKLVPCRCHGQDTIAGSPNKYGGEEIAEGVVLASKTNHDEDHDDACLIGMFSFVHGEILSEVTLSYQLLYDLGVKIAYLHRTLKEFSEANRWISGMQLYDPDDLWDLRNMPAAIDSRSHILDTKEQQNLVQEISQRFQRDVLENLKKLDRQIIHGDLNDCNIIVGDHSNELKVQGFIDFINVTHSYRVLDLGVAIGYIMILAVRRQLDIIQASSHVFAGYQSEFPLEPIEIDMVIASAKARIAQSVVLGTFQYKSVTPGNDYVLFNVGCGLEAMDQLALIPDHQALSTMKSCLGRS